MWELVVALVIGVVIGWTLGVKKYLRLERFVSDPEVQAELAKLVHMCAERDKAWVVLGETRELEGRLLGEDRDT